MKNLTMKMRHHHGEVFQKIYVCSTHKRLACMTRYMNMDDANEVCNDCIIMQLPFCSFCLLLCGKYVNFSPIFSNRELTKQLKHCYEGEIMFLLKLSP